MATAKHKQFIRSKTPPLKKVKKNPRDLQVIADLADYRLLDTEQIMALHPEYRGLRNVQTRMQYLFHAGYVDRPPQQVSLNIVQTATLNDLQESSGKQFKPHGNYMIYALGNKGADLLYQDDPGLRKKIDWQQKNRQVQFPHIWHTMMRNNFRISVTLALKNSQTDRLASWRHGEELKDRVTIKDSKTGKNRPAPVKPDDFFILEEGNDRLPFFLEADRSTMQLSRFLNKLVAYEQWSKAKGHTKKFGIERFRVLTITISEERAQNLRRLAREVNPNTERYLFTCEKKYSFKEPSTILEPIWQSSKDDRPHHLLE